MVPLVDGDPDKDFWEQNPDVKYIPPFNKLYKKKFGGEMMWVLYFLEDPKSVFHRQGPAEKREIISETYIEGRFKMEDCEEYVEAYNRECLTEAERAYKKWGEMLNSFQEHFMSLDFKKSLADKLKMLKEIDTLWKSYIQAERMAKEELRYRVKGDRIESIIETGEI